MSISSSIKSIQNIMRKDAGVDGDAQRLGQLSWLLFLKIFDTIEEEFEEELESDYVSPIPKQYLWRNWAQGDKPLTGESLISFINQLFDDLKSLEVNKRTNPRGFVVQQAFSDAYNYMKDGTLLRQIIEKVDTINFHGKKDRHLFGDMYEQILKDLQSAGNAGEFYTPRAVTRFMVDRTKPQLGDKILDPATGTGGFLACSIDYLKANNPKTTATLEAIQEQVYGYEKKQLPHLLCVTNMMLHGIEVPKNVVHDNTLAYNMKEWQADKKMEVILSNPPFGGQEDDAITMNFPAATRTKETADLFLQLIIHLLKTEGRAAVVLPDGSLFGDGVTAKIKKQLVEECNLHTIVRLPSGVFNPYTGIKTNLLFFTKGKPTQDIWYYEHPYPEGVKNYSKTKPMQFEEFKPEQEWWGTEEDGFATRQENKFAWKVNLPARKIEAEVKAKPHFDKAAQLSEEIYPLEDKLEQLKASLKKAEKSDKKAIGSEVTLLSERVELLKLKMNSEEKTGNDILMSVYNFDIKNPHQAEVVATDPYALLSQYQTQQAAIKSTQDNIKAILEAALAQGDSDEC
ncbi:N-6 DNA methylase [Vibrio splendidus]